MLMSGRCMQKYNIGRHSDENYRKGSHFSGCEHKIYLKWMEREHPTTNIHIDDDRGVGARERYLIKKKAR